MWPGFGENTRILKWIVERSNGQAKAKEAALGWIPHYDDIDWNGLEFSKEQWDALNFVDRDRLKMQIMQQQELFINLYDTLPKEFFFERDLLMCRL